MSVDKLLRKAIDKHENREFAEAEKLYRKILSTKPRHLDANYLLGTLHAESGEFEKALQYLVRAAQLEPGSPMIQANLGNVYRQLGKPDLAVKSFSRAKQLMPGLFQAHFGLGAALMEMNEDFDKVMACFNDALVLAPNVPEIHQLIGLLHEKYGNTEAALQELAIARDLNPLLPGINSFLGCICLREGRNEAAAEYFREGCRISPDDFKSAYFLAIAEGRLPGEELKQKYTRSEFDSYAADFERSLVEKLGYTLPFRVYDTLRRVCGPDFRFQAVADLGCGTGLTGEVLRSATDRLTGIDLSEKMIERARAKKFYDHLYCGDVVTTLTTRDERYDLFVATDVLIYIGDIDPLLTAVVQHSQPGALFLFSTEISEGDGVLLQKSGRFAHSPSYVHEVMAAHGCTIVSEEVIDLRQELGVWLKGNLFIVRMPAGQ